MLQVSIIVELVRSWPRAVFVAATLAQALVWFLVPALFYAAPPGDLAFVLATGKELELGNPLGPPLAYWLAELGFRLAGGSIVGVYFMAQVCVIITFWAAFRLGTAIVGPQHAALALLLMVGVAAFSAPTPEFGPSVVAAPLTALTILHLWRALGEDRRRHWFAVALALALLLLTTYAGLILLGLIAIFLVADARGRAALTLIEPWLAGVVLVILVFPHLIWIDLSGSALAPAIARWGGGMSAGAVLTRLATLAVTLLAVFAGLALLIAVAMGWWQGKPEPAPVYERPPLDPFASRFVAYFAFAPILASVLLATVAAAPEPVGGLAPQASLVALAVVVALGDAIAFRHARLFSLFWAALLLIPPFVAVLAMLALPWAGVDLQVLTPAREMGRYFAENFERRTGRPLEIVAGDTRLASLVALGASPMRPSVYVNAEPSRSPWVTPETIRTKGAIIVWPASEARTDPPDAIKAAFPGLVAEVPRAFERPVQGQLSLLRIGWGMIRPQEQVGPPP